MLIEHGAIIPDGSFQNEARLVASWTKGEHMLPKTQKDIQTLFSKGHSVLIYDAQSHDGPLGHAAITATYPNNMIEVGTIVVPPEHRHKGIGSKATLAVLDLADSLFPGWGVFALANDQSAALFEKIGAKPMSTGELCSEVWEFCATCPKLPNQTKGKPFICCDVPYDITPLKNMAKQYLFSWLSANVWNSTGVDPARGEYDEPGCYR